MNKLNLLSILKGLVKQELGDITIKGNLISYNSGVVSDNVTGRAYSVMANYNTQNPDAVSCMFSTSQDTKHMVFVRGQERFDLILKLMEVCQDKQM